MSTPEVKFSQYRTFYEWFQERPERRQLVSYYPEESWKTPEKFFLAADAEMQYAAKLAKEGNPDFLTVIASTHRQKYSEHMWYRFAKPYYKLYPGLLLGLAGISIDIDCGLLKVPFPAFKVHFPENYFRETEGSPCVRGILISGRRKGDKYFGASDKLPLVFDDDADPNFLAIDIDCGDEEAHLARDVKIEEPCKPYALLETTEGKTISERLEEIRQLKTINAETGYFPSPEFQASLLRIAVGICFFAINSHQVIHRDLPENLRKALERAEQDKSPKRLKKIKSQIDSMGYRHGFTVGREIQIPKFQTQTGEDASQGSLTHRQLKFSHIRTGHMKWQPYGPKLEQRKLIFVAPTIVRPDLPLGQTSSRKVNLE